MPRQIFQLRISLSGVRPTIWRRVLVPGAYTLDRLHRVVQHAMGWRDCHLHSFEVDGVQYGEPDPDGDLTHDDDLTMHDELDVRLDAVAGKGTRLRYTYDFGDWWEHDLLVEDVVTADADERYPTCLDGERAAPPENVGGPQGYLLMLAALADPAHPEHFPMREWVGEGFDPAAFDAGRATTLLRRFC